MISTICLICNGNVSSKDALKVFKFCLNRNVSSKDALKVFKFCLNAIGEITNQNEYLLGLICPPCLERAQKQYIKGE